MNEAFEKWWDEIGWYIVPSFMDGFKKHIKKCMSLCWQAAAPQWQSMDSAPKDEEVWFWIVALEFGETFLDSSGRPILSPCEPHARLCKYGQWRALTKAILWQAKPEPPKQ